ncbi:TonB-dependent siderophore receptor [Pusillimonas noertemannii]|uniref:TonB-dependent siderophore receptor n=1 Tax=Pusillimonas noertemannii TaxID=305977 RepID=UPI001402F3A7|nr:TonB-dependent receptor [Pusillimonas noertemannii]NYT69358.1 TonB-dependent siderophore receptor [Pusillimonas noertemannii]
MKARRRPARHTRVRSLEILSISIALAFGVAPLDARAQDAAVQISIPAQPLGQALLQLGKQTSLQIFYAQELVNGLSAPAVSGNVTPEQALRQLLRGTRIEYSRHGNSVTLSRPASGDTAQLAPIRVQGRLDGTTEGTGSWRPTVTNTATRLSLSPRETPQTISVVTNQQMQDFGMTSVDDALRSVSGAVVSDRGNNGSFYYSRGFEMQSQYDGVPNPIGISNNNQNPQIENAFLDRVEVLQGAAGLLTGAGQPGGTINLVRKRPTDFFLASAEVLVASWDGRRVVGDISGPLLESGRIRGRLVAVADNTDSSVDYAYRHRRAAYGVVEADLTDTTTLEASVQYQKDTGRNDYGAPFAADGSDPGLSRSIFWGDAGQRTVKDYTLATLGLTQRLPGDWHVKGTFTHGKTNSNTFRDSYISGELDMTTGDGLRLNRLRSLAQDLSSNAVDVHATGPFQLFGRKHEAAFGLNGSSVRREYTGSGYVAPVPINVFTFNPRGFDDIPDGTPYFGDPKTTQYGAYGVGRFSLTDSLKFIAGMRVSNYKSENLLTGRTTSKENGVISPYAGLIYDLNSQYSVYVSYSDIFNPQTQQAVGGDTIKPVVGANYEAGIKGELLDRRLNVAAAVFRLEQTNLARRDESVPYDPSNACGGTCYIAADKVVSQGLDLSISGEIAPGWNVAVGYTLVDSKYASGADDGERYAPYLPRHNLRLSTTYKVPNTNWTLGGSLSVRSKIYRTDTSWTTGEPYTIRDGGLALVGLMARYQFTPKAELTMTVSNLFDRTYRANLENKYYSPWGEPRRFMANLRYQF